MASRFQDKDEKVGKKSSETHSANRAEHKETKWYSMGYIILLLVVAVLCGYCCYAVSQLSKSVELIQNRTDTQTTIDTVFVNSGTGDEIAVNENVETSANDNEYKDYRIDISPSPINGKIKPGINYNLSVMKGDEKVDIPGGIFEGSSGIIINKNTFSTDTTSPINVQIFYTVNNKRVITRTLTIQ